MKEIDAALVVGTSDNKIKLTLSYGRNHCSRESYQRIEEIRSYCISKDIEEIILLGEQAEAEGDKEKSKELYSRFIKWAKKLTVAICPGDILEGFSQLESKSKKSKVFLRIIFEEKSLALIPIEVLHWKEKFLSERFITGRSFDTARPTKDLKISHLPLPTSFIINTSENEDEVIKRTEKYVINLYEEFKKKYHRRLLHMPNKPSRNENMPKTEIVLKLLDSEFLVYFGHCEHEKGWVMQQESGSKPDYFSEIDISNVPEQISPLPTLIFSYTCQSIGLAEAFGKKGVGFYMGTFWSMLATVKSTDFVNEFLNAIFNNLLTTASVAEIFWQIANKKTGKNEYCYPFSGRSYGLYCDPTAQLIETSDVIELIRKLSDTKLSQHERIKAIKMLDDSIGMVHFPVLIEAFGKIIEKDDENPEVIKEVLFTIAKNGEKGLVSHLLKGLENSRDKEICQWIIGTLGSIAGDESEKALEEITRWKKLDKQLCRMAEEFLSIQLDKKDLNQQKTIMEELLNGRRQNPGISHQFDWLLIFYLKNVPSARKIILEIAGDLQHQAREEAVEMLRILLQKVELQHLYVTDINDNSYKIQGEFRKLAQMGCIPVIDFLLQLNINKSDHDLLVFLIEMLGEIPPDSPLIEKVLEKLREIGEIGSDWIKNLVTDMYHYIENMKKKEEATHGI